MTPTKTLALAAALCATAAITATTADAARIDPADYGYVTGASTAYGARYSADDFLGFSLTLAAGAGPVLIISGLPPTTAAGDFDLAWNPAGPLPVWGGAADVLGDDGAAGFDLLFHDLVTLLPGATPFPAQDGLLVSVAYDSMMIDPASGLRSGDATATVTRLNPAPIPLPAGGWLMLTGLGALALRRRARRAGRGL